MKSIPSLKDSIRSLFEHMTLRFAGDRFPFVDITYQFVFTDIENGYPVHISFSNGRATFQDGYSDDPSVTVTVSSQCWLDIAGGHKNPLWAFITQKLSVKGNFSRLGLLPKLLTKSVAVPRSQTFSHHWTMPRNVLVLIGNPRKKRGLTWFYLEPFMEGIRSTGVEPEVLHLYDKKIGHCLGCFHCWTKTPGTCVQQDDQGELLRKLDSADVIVYALPLYYHSVPGLVKAHLDRQITRMHPYFEKAGNMTRHPRRVERKQSVALFAISGFPEIGQFSSLVHTFEAYARHDNSSFIGPVLIPGAMEVYYNPTHRSLLLDKVEHLWSAGKQLMENGHIRKKTLKVIAKPPASGDKWRIGANWHWHRSVEEGRSLNKKSSGIESGVSILKM